MSTVSDIVRTAVEAHPAPKIISTPKLTTKVARPTSMTSHEARLRVSEKNNLNMSLPAV